MVWFGNVKVESLVGFGPILRYKICPYIQNCLSKSTKFFQFLNIWNWKHRPHIRHWASRIGHKLTWNTCPYQTKPNQSFFSCFIGFVKLHLWITPKTEHVWFHGHLILVLWCHTLNLPYSTPLRHFFNKYYATGHLCTLSSSVKYEAVGIRYSVQVRSGTWPLWLTLLNVMGCW